MLVIVMPLCGHFFTIFVLAQMLFFGKGLLHYLHNVLMAEKSEKCLHGSKPLKYSRIWVLHGGKIQIIYIKQNMGVTWR